MMEYIDLSVPVAPSGKFIELHQSGVFLDVVGLWGKCGRLKRQLEEVESKLASCNDLDAMAQFAKSCQRNNKDFERELRLLEADLVKWKASLLEQIGRSYSELRDVDSYLLPLAIESTATQVSHRRNALSFAAARSSIDILKRNSIIQGNPNCTSRELCERFDSQQIELPEKWAQYLEEVSWRSAYRNPFLRRRIHKMISNTRRQLRLLP
jgi:hypothetical protein